MSRPEFLKNYAAGQRSYTRVEDWEPDEVEEESDDDDPDIQELAGRAWEKAAESKSDPSYNDDIRQMRRDVTNVADEVTSVNIIGGKDPHIELRLRQKHNRSLRTETAVAVGRLFEAPVVREHDYQPGDTALVSHRQPPKHTHYRDDRRR